MNAANRDFTTYDYMEICAEEAKLSFLIDCSKCFGWHLDENNSSQPVYDRAETVAGEYGGNNNQPHKLKARMKRDRKIINKAELTRLQRNFESCAEEIDKMEKAMVSRAQMAAIALGVIGTVFMALSVFAVTAEPPHIVLTVFYAIPGFAGWIFPYFVYRKVAKQQREKLLPLIEQKREEIDLLCEKGSRLLGN